MENRALSNFHRTGILITLLISSFITAMSTTVTVNMIPNLMVYFDVSSGAAQWLTSGATLLSGIIIPVTAFLIKRVPNKYYYLAAMLFGLFGSGLAAMQKVFVYFCVMTVLILLLVIRLLMPKGQDA